MPISITCSSCGHSGQVADRFAGRLLECPKCHTQFHVDGGPSPAAGAVCSGCGSSMPAQAVICTRCGLDVRTGKRHQPASIRTGGNEATVACPECSYQGRSLMAPRGYRWYDFVIGILLLCSGLGIIPLAYILSKAVHRRYETCPQCGNRTGLEFWGGVPSPDSDAILERATRRTETQSQRARITILVSVLVLLVFAIGFAIWMTR